MSAIVDISEILLEIGLSDAVTDEERAISQTALVKASGAVLRYLHYDPVQKVHTTYLPQMDFALRSRDAIWEVDSAGNNAFVRRLSEVASDELQVQHIPIRETDENGDNAIDLRIDFDARSGTRANSFGSETLKIEGDDFWPNYDSEDSGGRKICRDGIIRAQGRWPSVAGSVKVVYVAGYTRAELHGQDSVVDASPLYDVVVDESVRRILKAFSRRKRAGAGFSGPFKSERLGDYKYETDTKILDKLVGGSFDLLPENKEKLSEFCHYSLGVM